MRLHEGEDDPVAASTSSGAGASCARPKTFSSLGYARSVTERRRPTEDEDDRPPICPACGVTQGMKETGDDEVEFVCLECGFSDARPA